MRLVCFAWALLGTAAAIRRPLELCTPDLPHQRFHVGILLLCIRGAASDALVQELDRLKTDVLHCPDDFCLVKKLCRRGKLEPQLAQYLTKAAAAIFAPYAKFFYIPPLLGWLAGSSRTSAELTTEDILQSVSVQDEGSEDGMNDDASEGVAAALEDRNERLTTADVRDSIRKLRTFPGKTRTATKSVHRNMEELESFVLGSSWCPHQKKISNYLK
ncbi:uncharacterized protein LOC144174963 [Haemaphysalis longicornis]